MNCDLNNDNREIILNFFLNFSRLEYALKCQSEYTKASPYFQVDWEKFENFFVDKPIPSELEESINYLKYNPPRKQTGHNSWKNIEFVCNWDLLIKSLKTVRNNLFHGGKYTTGPLLEPIRDQILLNHCNIILDGLVKNGPLSIQEKFKETK